MSITAKVKCSNKQEISEGAAIVEFSPDYAQGRNSEWAAATPTLSLRMTLNGAVADRFIVGKAFTLTFEEENV